MCDGKTRNVSDRKVKFNGWSIASVFADIAPLTDSGKVFSMPSRDPPDSRKIFPRSYIKWAR